MTGIGTSERQWMQIDAQARVWHLKLQRGAVPPEEMEAFGQWMATSANASAYADCEWSGACVRTLDASDDVQWAGWRDEAMQRARTGAPKVEPLADWSDLVFARNTRTRRRQASGGLASMLGMAACLVVVALGVSWRHAGTSVLHYQAGDATREVLLPDGTRLTLDAGTSVDYMRTGETRRLLLPEGRIYLNVSKDPQHARFVVQSGEVETIVLGTRFQVSQTAARTEVVLEEGKVRMERRGTALSTTLESGQRGWWAADATGFSTEPARPSSVLAWTRGRLLFENVALAEAIAEVNRYSKHVQIELADPGMGELKVNGSYVAGDPELVVAAWETILPLHAQHQGDRIRLERR